MAAAVHPSIFLTIGAAALVAWRMYARVRRLIGRQTLSRARLGFTISIFPVLTVLLAFGARTDLQSELAMAGGIVVGVVLGIFGLRHTKYESAPAGLFYTPNAHIGIALSLLLAGRILYRIIQVTSPDYATHSTAQFVSSPLTLAIYGTLAGYYFTYAVGILCWSARIKPALPQSAPH